MKYKLQLILLKMYVIRNKYYERLLYICQYRLPKAKENSKKQLIM